MRPLAGKRILITRAKEQAQDFAQQIKALGGIPIVIPLLSIQSPRDLAPVKRAIRRLDTFNWLVLTSQNGVHRFFQFVKQENGSIQRIGHLKIAVVGEKTLQTLQSYGVSADVVPRDEFTAEALLDCLLPQLEKGDRLLLARGNLARTILPDRLRNNGMEVVDIAIYETVTNRDGQHELRHLLAEKRLDAVAFTSSSTAKHFIHFVEDLDWKRNDHLCLAAIGPITANTMTDLGIAPTVVAEKNTTEGLIEAIARYFKAK